MLLCTCFYCVVSLELLVQDVKQMKKGFENARNELVHDKSNTKVKVRNIYKYRT